TVRMLEKVNRVAGKKSELALAVFIEIPGQRPTRALRDWEPPDGVHPLRGRIVLDQIKIREEGDRKIVHRTSCYIGDAPDGTRGTRKIKMVVLAGAVKPVDRERGEGKIPIVAEHGERPVGRVVIVERVLLEDGMVRERDIGAAIAIEIAGRQQRAARDGIVRVDKDGAEPAGRGRVADKDREVGIIIERNK